MESSKLLDLMVEAVDDKRAQDITVYDVKNSSPVTDYFVICLGNTERQTQAIADEVRDEATKNQLDVKLERYGTGKLIFCDFGDAIVHMYVKTEREYYNLERIFKDDGDSVRHQ